MVGEPELSTVGAAFVRARVAVAEHTDAMHAAGATWREETLTELVLRTASPTVKFADFNRREEALVGADWLWWWVSPDGTSFGALVQAKNLTFTQTGTPKVEYKHAGGRQLANLLAASDVLEVPAMYAIYFGGLGYRNGWPCQDGSPGCDGCLRRAITMAPALVFTGDLSPALAAERAVESGLALEQLSGAESWWHRSVPSRLQVTRDVAEFLSEPQHGARAVAREVFARVSLRRVAEFGGIEEAAPPLPLDAPDAITSDRVFIDLPHDRMHNTVEYFDHVLRGLRRTPPGYVLDVLDDNPPDSELTNQVAGIVVVTLE
ncbi:MAG: hypothetical protein JWO98_4019 [Frankiales bacterium]|nr:hypothetical protein [Frankiales bacterium]